MDRLISEQKAIEAINDYWGEMEIPTIDGYINAIKTIPSAKPYKGMTNGDVIKTLFPNIYITDHFELNSSIGNIIYVRLGKYQEMRVQEDWWNSPYEPQEGSK